VKSTRSRSRWTFKQSANQPASPGTSEEPSASKPIGSTLASLFLTCVERLEEIQQIYLESDSHMIRETKLNNLVVRLTAWGKACGLHDPNRYDQRLESPDLRPHLERTLRCVAEQLIDRKLRQHSDHEREYPVQPMIMSWLNLRGQWRGLSGHHEHIPPDGAVPASGQATTQRQGIIQTMLDNLLRDLRGFIEDLEVMTRTLDISGR
jgi:Prion-inhibition and propagation